MNTEPVPKWETTRLWEEIDRREGEPAKRLKLAIAGALPKAEAVLTNGDSGPGTFTLHDAHHSWNVAQHMASLAGEDLVSEMEPYDLGLLLLSAYLHDIGMTPPVSRLNALQDYLLSGDSGELDEAECDELQAWLDDNADGKAPPMSDGPPTVEVLQEVRSLLAQYVRARHNEWSGAWIAEHLAEMEEQTYEGFLADLVLLCASHHFGYEKLQMDEFDPRLVGSPSTVLHLRFDACLLRVADVLDFDPERTPKILYAHRDVEDTSAIFWHKDHKLAFAQKGNRLLIHARPTNALVHHAIDLTVRDVDRELQLCRRLAEENPFDRMGDESLPHRWTLEMKVRATVKPRDGAYEYIDGTFRPDHERILELLGGVALYGSSMAAIRELLQNAFDAVREQIAYQRLRHDEPASDAAREQIAAMHRVTLILEEDDGGVRLICRDTGVGMTREVIKSRFLVGGSRPSHETRSLERDCRDLGFSVGRTARFGIGVLAYFLLGSHLSVRTRRSIEAGDAKDEAGWTFVSEGLTDFGELRRNPDCLPGTEVELLMRRDVMSEGVQEFAENLDAYVRSIVRRVPCHFTFLARGSGIEPFTCEPGWVDHTKAAEETILSPMSDPERQLREADSELLSSEMRRTYERKRENWQKIHAHALQRLKIELEDGELPDDLGSYRIFRGHFEIEDQPALMYLDLIEDDSGSMQIRPIEGGLGVAMGSDGVMSWNGMRIRSDVDRGAYGPEARLKHSGICFEVDWTSDAAGELAVDRGRVTLSEKAEEAIDFVRERALSLQGKLVREHQDSPFLLFNAHIAAIAIDAVSECRWPLIPEHHPLDSPVTLGPLTFPAIDKAALEPALKLFSRLNETEAPEDTDGLRWRGEDVSTTETMMVVGNGDLSWHGSLFAPQYLGVRLQPDGQTQPIKVWTRFEASEHPIGDFVLEFPSNWHSLACVNIEMRNEPKAWNAAHPLIQAIDPTGLSWAEETFFESRDPVPHQAELLQSRSRVASWIHLCIQRGERDLWVGLQEREPNLLPDAWKLLGFDEQDEILVWEESYFERHLKKISSTSWAEQSEKGIVEAVGAPDEEWWLS